ncbi:ubiquinol-cytochrome c reductase iron-sulfur subunit [Corynebacterium sp.]|uniref:cytochrome bc1 complex Rieske iron-sulfur subunit n=1 Tax=Corynebacterium sp. TaxID=1720 RepID=UPI0026DA827B|nr:ubiquinol-cytochrome c reductase iron-sulfur subunit [Corynebacterium sp.]MDO4609090.1 ubiquinol-cytochrome c reductase iron-sulfur subunit [Corynebacterium sp.]
MSDNNIKKNYSSEELSKMSNEELARLGTELDDVTIAFRKERFPIENDPAEKRAARGIIYWLTAAVVLGIAFIAVYLFWPWEYKGHGEEGLGLYTAYTPLLGFTAGGSILALGVAAVKYTKRFIPEEISVQRRHDGPSDEVDQKTIVALLNDSWQTSTLGRRKAIKGLLGTGAVLAGISMILPLGGMIKNPWRPRHELDVTGDGTLWTTGWTLAAHGEKIYLGRDTGAIAEKGHHGYTTHGVSRLVRIRPEDLSAGAMETVFPLPEADVNDGDRYDAHADVYEHHMHSIHGSRNPVMLIRLRSQDAAKAVLRQGQEDFHYGDFFAYSKICTHIGCPTSLYEAQTNRILCPCHQSQFNALEYGKPVFGPAARALPELPINVDEEGFLYADGDFCEPVGPAFWERKS